MITPRDKERARTAASNAVAAGKLVRGPCEEEASGVCKSRIEGHHDDYSRPLVVRWLCLRHHRRWDEDHPEAAGAPDEKPKNGTRRVIFSLPDELGAAVKARAVFEERTVSNMVARLLKQGMAKLDQDAGTK